MGEHTDNLKQKLSPEAFEDFYNRNEDILPMREEVADELRDLNPDGIENSVPESFFVNPWGANWIRQHKKWNLKEWNKMAGQWVMDAMYRMVMTFEITQKAKEKKPSVEELVTNKWTGYLSAPPTFVARADIAFSANQALYGKYATALWAVTDYWKDEIYFLAGYHLEDGAPVVSWTPGLTEDIASTFGEKEAEEMITVIKSASPESSLPTEDPSKYAEKSPENMNRRHLRHGIKLKDMPKKRPFTIIDWTRPVREIVMDLREEMFPDWTHATPYIALGPGFTAITTLQNFWGMSQWWNDPWICMNAKRIFGWPIELYHYEPLPPILNTMLALPLETWIKRLSQMYFLGPKNMHCDPIPKLRSPGESAPLIHDLRNWMFESGDMYKDFALPYDEGIPPPTTLLTALPCPFYKEADIEDFITNPEELSKEYWELLESEGGVNRESGRIPPYDEVPRLKWLFDPTIEWLKPEDFPPLNWTTGDGQIWPMDITREKMEIMVDEGYDGSGKDILHYSALADKKMGQEGKTIMLGTTPYKLPTE